MRPAPRGAENDFTPPRRTQMQHASQQAPAKDPRYPLTGSIVQHDIRQVTTDGSSYVVLTLNRGEGKDPV